MTRSHFKEAMSLLASGVSILTCQQGEDLCGITISSLTSVDLDPPTILVCVDGKSALAPVLRNTRSFGVTILREDQLEIGQRFSNPKFSNLDRFKSVQVETINNCPLIRGGLAQMTCDLQHEVFLSENFVFFGRITHIEAHVGRPLIYFHRQWQTLR